jgi:hypothetical protein
MLLCIVIVVLLLDSLILQGCYELPGNLLSQDRLLRTHLSAKHQVANGTLA